MTQSPDTAENTVRHPLDPITAHEIQTLKAVLAEAGHGGPQMRYAYVMLREPDHGVLD
ncbi:hypothetical protein [Roseobacter sp. GAI101]|uniref:hypothetical protein n=1 Tax=Roseobacter sp. (strain GAI101) TaxID=391589 RepID=UPI0001871603|nr:hypothetical protein [Roseobacter sp. GAI101]EEB85114.1 hypothetical protein RGAI101_2264 [Roseobacter sp. GAI101]